ncbi:Endochitinase [Frankliniella fusca]|uniref:Endochitinase n=1 Tax=Frankliniella fusca TaxID=407009 RepID=A0AAE1HV22_9NEOP|nr:Endochitinase [Frankliniella fusca]
MNTILILTVLVAAICQQSAALRAPRTPAELLHMSRTLALAATPNDDVCQNTTNSCADCNRVNLCAYVGGHWAFLKTSTCPDSAPFCEAGKCVKEDRAGCNLPPVSADFRCYDGFDGYYPSPDDCAKYYVCSKGVAYVYNCQKDHIYSQARGMCVRKDTDPDACYVFPCSGDEVSYHLYKPDQAIYGVCTPGLGVSVSRCPTANYRIDPLNPYSPCTAYCSKQGRIPDIDDPRKYYECNLVPIRERVPDCTRCSAPGTLTDPVPQYCPPNTVFNSRLQRCLEPDAVLP